MKEIEHSYRIEISQLEEQCEAEKKTLKQQMDKEKVRKM
jgi:hypothetical protein